MKQLNPSVRKVLLASLVGLVAIPVAGCAHHKPTATSDEFDGFMAKAVRLLEKRAPHDLGCPAEQLTYKDLSGATVGVDGCGNRAAYKWISGAGWVMDSAAENAAK